MIIIGCGRGELGWGEDMVILGEGRGVMNWLGGEKGVGYVDWDGVVIGNNLFF